MKHTKGPWTYKDGILSSEKESIAVLVIPKNVVGNEPERTANANLIAAAPEMLEALESLLRLADITLQKEGSITDSIRDNARNTIKKARGES